MNNKAAAIMAALFCFLLLSLTAGAETVFSDEIINNAKHSVIAILNASGNGFGTGFAIGVEGQSPQYFVTNYHVLADKDYNLNSKDCSVVLGYFDSAEDRIPAKIMCWSADYDIAIIKTEIPVDSVVPAKLLDCEVQLGTEVFSLGFSGESMLNDRSYAGAENAVYADGEITLLSYNPETENHTTLDTYQMTSRLSPGYSGGPVLNKDGIVIGVNCMTHQYTTDDGIVKYKNSFAVKSSNVCALIDTGISEGYIDADFEYMTVSAEADSEQASDTQVIDTNKNPKVIEIVLFGLLVVTMVCVLIWFYVVLKNNRIKTNPAFAVEAVEGISEPPTRIYGRSVVIHIGNISEELTFDQDYRILYQEKPVALIKIYGSPHEISIFALESDFIGIGYSNQKPAEILGKNQPIHIPLHDLEKTHIYFGSTSNLLAIEEKKND